MAGYNGWTNKETWLVNIWYMPEMPQYFSDMEEFEVDASDLEGAVKYIAEECEALSQLPPGLLSDFISTCWAEVNWHELSEALNKDLAEMAVNA